METNRPIIGPIYINEIHSSGKGVGVWKGKNYFIPHSLPGEEYFVRTENRRLGFRTAKILSFEKQSHARVVPTCPYYGVCGGCNFMHIHYNEQLVIKKTILQNAFNKYKIPYKATDVTPASEAFFYRNKATFQVKYIQDKIQIGFHPEWSKNELVEIESCYILKPVINEYFAKINMLLRRFFEESKNVDILSFTIRCNSQSNVMLIVELSRHPSETLLVFFDYLKMMLKTDDSFYYFIKPSEKYACPEIKHIKNTSLHLFESIQNINLRISPFTFFQNNVEITEKIVHFIKSSLNFDAIKTVIDLYSGNGTMSLPLVINKNVELWGIEGNPSAIDDAIFNSTEIANHHHILGDVLKTFTSDFLDKTPHPDIIILDPPRSGTLIEIQKNIIKASPSYIVYVSCNPVSLAWNIQQLITAYKIIDVRIFDMFPQTHQFETVVILENLKDFA